MFVVGVGRVAHRPVSDVGGPDEPIDVGNPSGFFAWAIDVGFSARGAIDEFRSIGGSGSNDKLRGLYAQTYDTIMRTADFMSTDYNSLPSASDWGTWQMGRGGQYAMQVVIQQSDPDSGLTSESYYTVVKDEPFSKADAEEQAMIDFGNPANEDRYGLQVLGAVAVHGWLTVPWES